MNIGSSTRLGYDVPCYSDRVKESTSPLLYKLDPNQIHNCNTCLSTLGPRSSIMGNGVSTNMPMKVAMSQQLVDVESVMRNLNVPLNKCKSGKVQPINLLDPEKYPLQHPAICNQFLNPVHSRLSHPAQTYRSIATNRFYDLNKPAQQPLFEDFQINTRLESKDNFIPRVPVPMNEMAQPVEAIGPIKRCSFGCK